MPVEVSSEAGKGAAATLKGDWNDVDAAAEMGTWHAECVWVGPAVAVSATERVYHLRHISDATGTLTAKRADAEHAEDIEITLTCTMGRFGEPAIERNVVAKTARRLGDLRGVEVAPMRE